MNSAQGNPSRKEVLERIGMTEDQVKQLFEEALTAPPEEFAALIKGHENDIAAIAAVMETPDEIIARVNKLAGREELQ